jgi:hypothetical protein
MRRRYHSPMKSLSLFAAFVLCAAAAQAGAMAQACMDKPSGRPKALCVCLENEFNKRLTSEERKIEILAVKGKYMEFRRKTDALGQAGVQSFQDRVAATLAACQASASTD